MQRGLKLKGVALSNSHSLSFIILHLASQPNISIGSIMQGFTWWIGFNSF